MNRTRPLLITMAAVLALGLASCGGGASTTPSSDATSSSAEFTDGDVEFLQMMVPHHEQALVLADIALDPTRGASQAIIDLATQIKAAQSPEIELMVSLLDSWGEELDEHAMHNSDDDMGMLSDDEIDELSAMSGGDFDTAWAKAMLVHHRGAVAMAEDVLSNGANQEVMDLARAIIATQNAEIAVLEPLS